MMRHVCVLISSIASMVLASGASGKVETTYFSPAEVADIKARAKDSAHQGELQYTREAADLLASRSDEEIWALVPPADLIRAINVRFGTDCPVHGAEVFKKGGHYPWIMYADKPYKVECPIGHETYPSNDFAAYLKSGRKEKLDTKEKYVDDGNGWTGGPEGKPFFFVAYYNFWQVWRATILQGVEACGKVYLATGDEKYAHKAAVCLARVSQVYPQCDWSKQGVSDGKFPAGWTGKINDRIWECDALTRMAVAYDVIAPTIAGDEALKKLAAANGIDDVSGAIERDVLQVGAAAIMNGQVHGNKMELSTLSTIALVLKNDDSKKGVTTKQMADWILTGPGELEFTFYNGICRDGIGGESSPGYSSIWNSRLIQVANNLSRLGMDITSDRKWLRVAKGPAELCILGRMTPRLGDTGGGLGGSGHGRDAEMLKFAVRHFNDPDAAKWLAGMPAASVGRRPTTQNTPMTETPLFARESLKRDQLEKLAAGASFPPAPLTRNLGGYGLAMLELDDGSAKRGATLYYGGVENFHCNKDRLTLGYFVNEREALTELGYPSHWGPTAAYWVQNTPSHYCVMVDGQAQTNKAAGYLTDFADLDGLKVAGADATVAWTGPAAPFDDRPKTAPDGAAPLPRVKQYHRTLALLDTGEQSTLLIDGFLVRGGKLHDYSFHGLPWGKFEHDLKLTKSQEKGTLAGENVEYGEDPKNGLVDAGYQYLKKPRWFEPADITRVSWIGDNGLTQHTWFPRFTFNEVIVADGVPPLRSPNPPTMPYVLLRNQGDDLTSLFMSITDVDQGPTKVKAVRRIASNSPAAGGAVIEMASGKAWRIYINRAGADVTFEDGVASSVPFAAVHVIDGKAAKAKLVGAGQFTPAGGSTIDVQPIRMTVSSVDYATNTARVEAAPDSALLGKQGRVVCAQTGPHSASYTIKSANDATLGFGEVGLITGRFHCAWDDGQKKLVAHERIEGHHNQFHGRSFIGRTVVSEDLKTTATITGYDREARTFTIDADGDGAAKFADANGDDRPYVYIADIAPGTTLVATPVKEVKLGE